MGNTERPTAIETVERGKKRVYVSLGSDTACFTLFKEGVYTFGNQQPKNFINANRSLLSSLGISESAINVILAVSENEGNMDAINTWDNSFLTFGMFQWTVGAGSNKGELPAFVNKIKKSAPKVFDRYFGEYGLNIEDANRLTGYFSLDGKKLSEPKEKELLRTYEWAFFFWLAGQNPVIHSLEIEQALSRINIFYKSDSYKVKGFYISDIITSEYGVALILDNHVNRPGYLKGCLEKALDETGLTDPYKWGDEEERKFIRAYLDIRQDYGKYPMTHAAKRAANVADYLDKKIVSDQRGSFIFNLS